MVFAHFKIGNELDGVGGTGVFTKTAKDAAGEIDPEELGVAAAVFIFCGLEGYAIDGADSGAEITAYTALFSFRVAC